MADVHVALAEKPYYLQAPGSDPAITYTAEEFRRHDSAIFHKVGVLTPPSFKVAQTAVVGWSVLVGAGWAVLGSTFDKYTVVSTTATTVNLSGFNTSPSATRTHRIWLCVYDDAYTGSTTGQAQIVATEDTTGAGAVAPSDARHSLLLANVFISPGQSNIQTANISTGSTVRVGGYDGYTLSGANGLSLSTGITDAISDTNTAPVSLRVANGLIYLTGAVTRSSSSYFVKASTYPIGVLPADLAPVSYKAFACTGGPNLISGNDAYSDYMYKLVITNNRQVFAYIPDGYTTNYLYFDGAYWALDT